MSDPFRQFFLDTIERVVDRDPNEESLIELLSMVQPSIEPHQFLTSPSERKKAYKMLQLRIHPDKHPHDSRATSLFQNVNLFYEKCVASLTAAVTSNGTNANGSAAGAGVKSTSLTKSYSYKNKRKRKSSSLRSSNISLYNHPTTFTIHNTWSHMDCTHPSPSSIKKITSNNLPALLACRCLNARGAIVHGKPITKSFDLVQMEKYASSANSTNSQNSVQHVFDAVCGSTYEEEDKDGKIKKKTLGGTKELTSIEEIKQEILTNGPVISTSFVLLEAFYDMISVTNVSGASGGASGTNGVSGAGSDVACTLFTKERIGQCHELLIVGWNMTTTGEVWQVQPLLPSSTTSSSASSSTPTPEGGTSTGKGGTGTGTGTGKGTRKGTGAPQAQDQPPQDDTSTTTTTTNNKTEYFTIGFGQFGIDETCLAPIHNLENLSWQPGPYFDSDFTDAPTWREWKEMDLPISSMEFESLAKCFEKGIVAAANAQEKFVIRDSKKLAHSASYFLKDVRWEEGSSEWIVTLVLNEG